VTVAGWLVVLGSVFVVLTVFERISSLHSLETRQSIEKFLSEPPGDGLGLDVDGMLVLIRTLAMVAAGCATAAAILGFHVLRRSRSARLALSVVAVPLFVTGLASGGFMSSVVLAATVMLWVQPARDWFDGVSRVRADPHAPTGGGPAPQTPPAPVSPGPRAFPGFGSGHPSERPVAAPVLVTALPRPAAVVWACVLTWICTGLVMAGLLLSVVILLAAPDLVFDELRRQNPDYADQGLSDAAIKGATYVVAGVGVVWSVVASVLAVLVYRRVDWARTGLVVCAAVAGGVCVIATLGNLLLLLPGLGAIAVVVLLLRPEVRVWSRGPRG
jgi:hypothetical protein